MVCRDVPLAPSEPGLASDGAAAGTVAEAVVGSFVEGGLTYAVVDEGKASLMAVDPAGSAVKPDEGAEGQLSSASDATVFEQMVDPDGDGVSMFASDGCDASAILALPAAVEHGGVAYELSSLGPRALAGCAAEAVVIPATVSSIDETALLDAAVQRVEVDSANPAYASFDGVLYSADLVRLLSIPGGRKGAVRIPDNTEAIEPSALSHMAGVTSVSVDAGSATFSSRNGCLYDATGDTILWEPLAEGSVQGRELGFGTGAGVVENTRVYPDPRNGNLTIFARKALSGAGTSSAVFGEVIKFENLPYWPFVTRLPYYVLSLNGKEDLDSQPYGTATQWIRGPFSIAVGGYTYTLPAGDWRVEATVSRPGYLFDGWLVGSEGGSSWTENYPLSNTNYYPSWVPGRFEITPTTGKNLNQALDKVYVTYGKGFYSDKACITTPITHIPPPKATDYQAPGKSFLGWWTLDDKKNWSQKVTDENGRILVDALTFADDTPIYSKWGPPFTATFDANGGKLSLVHVIDGGTTTDASFRTHDVKWSYATVRSNGYVATSYQLGGHSYWCSITPTKMGWTFLGWKDERGNLLAELATGPDDSVQAIAPGLTYKAQWGMPLSATLDANGGTIKVWEGQKTERPPLATYQRGVIAWNDSTRIYGQGKVQYYLKDEDGKRTGSEAWAERDGYAFRGWTIDYAEEDTQDGRLPGPADLKEDDSRTLAPGATYKAKWGAPYRATFDPNGGAISVCHVVGGGEERWTSSEPHAVRWEHATARASGYVATSNTLGESLWCSLEPVSEGRTFLRWKDQKGGILPEGSSGPDDTLQALAPGAVYKAQWNTHRYRVSFDPKDGAWDDAEAGETVSVEFDQDVSLAAAPKREGYLFEGWEVAGPDGVSYSFDANAMLAKGKLRAAQEDQAAVPISYGEMAVEGQEPVTTVVFSAKWVPDLRVDVPIQVSFDLRVDWEQQRIVVSAPGTDGGEHATGAFHSWSSADICVSAFGQEAATVAGHRANALDFFASGEEAKAGNLDEISLVLSAGSDGSPSLSFPLSGLYGPGGDPPLLPGDDFGQTVAALQDLTPLRLVVPAAPSAGSPGTLEVRYGIECTNDLDLRDVAIDDRPRPILSLVYQVELSSS